MRLPYFSRSQLGVILLLGAALIGLYAWRANFWLPPSPAPPGNLDLVFVEVSGKAPHPGVYSFHQPPSLREIWAKAGIRGNVPDPERKIPSGSRIEVMPDGGYRLVAMSGAQLLTLGLPIDLNQASEEDLDAVPGIGPALAKRIVDYRKAHGPFRKIEELEEKVPGFGPKKMAGIKPYLSIKE